MKNYKQEDPIPNLIEEPQALWLSPSKYFRISSVLGGSDYVSPILDEMDLIATARKGLSKSVLLNLSNILGLSIDKLSQLMHISVRTIQRKKSDDLMNTAVSEHIIDIAGLVSVGIEVLGSLDAFNSWIREEVYALKGQRPIDLMDTGFGVKILADTLHRLEHGVYA